MHYLNESYPSGGGGGRGVELPGSPNPDPISDQTTPFSIAVSRPDL